MKSFTEYGYDGNNFSESMSAALAVEPEVYIPGGNYTLAKPLLIPSRRKITAAENAVITADDGHFTGGETATLGSCEKKEESKARYDKITVNRVIGDRYQA